MYAQAEGGRTSEVRHYDHGPRWLARGGVKFRVWAPGQEALKLRIAGRSHNESPFMKLGRQGWQELDVTDVAPGDRYAFELRDGAVVPDPASRFQPDDVHGWSELLGHSPYAWRVDWQGRPWEEMVIYELHVGTFTREGTFLAAIDKLDHLAGLGVTAIEIMPVADFAGARNWGYDGVYLYAPDASYGRPDDLRALVDAAHERGIAALLDVVYNHFGPEGNYLPRLAPQFFTARHQTPWGAGINFDDAGSGLVREFFVQNALYWLHEFRFDGLRLDAVHAIQDDSSTHLLDEIAMQIRREFTDRPIHLILENEENQTRHLLRERDGAIRRYSAQWNDDLHHALHAVATRESAGYYEEYLDDTQMLARAIAEGFAFQGQVMRYRGRPRGAPSKALPPTAFVGFLQNHDQIGNRAFGERIGALAPLPALRAVTSVYLLAPQIPMLFMGEEWNARQPFQFFCDFHGALAEDVRRGRREEFKRFAQFADAAQRERIPDAQSEQTFEASKLCWDDRALPEHAAWLRWYQRLLVVRRAHIVPLLREILEAGEWRAMGDGAVFVCWDCARGRELHLAANLSDEPHGFPYDDGRVLWHEGEKPDGSRLAPWSVRWTLAEH